MNPNMTGLNHTGFGALSVERVSELVVVRSVRAMHEILAAIACARAEHEQPTAHRATVQSENVNAHASRDPGADVATPTTQGDPCQCAR
jgi:hypothetical protein